MNQKQIVLDHMKRNGSITRLDAFRLGIAELSARIIDLEKDGYVIPRSTVTVRKSNGKDAKVKRYSISPSLLSAPLMKLTDAKSVEQAGVLFDVPVSRESFDNSGKANR